MAQRWLDNSYHCIEWGFRYWFLTLPARSVLDHWSQIDSISKFNYHFNLSHPWIQPILHKSKPTRNRLCRLASWHHSWRRTHRLQGLSTMTSYWNWHRYLCSWSATSLTQRGTMPCYVLIVSSGGPASSLGSALPSWAHGTTTCMFATCRGRFGIWAWAGLDRRWRRVWPGANDLVIYMVLSTILFLTKSTPFL